MGLDWNRTVQLTARGNSDATVFNIASPVAVYDYDADPDV